MLNVYPTNDAHQEQTHFFTRNVNTYHHDCPFCNQQFYFPQSQFIQNANSLSKSGFHQGPPMITNTSICDNPNCFVCGHGSPRPIDSEEVYEYQRNLPPPCAICGDCSFAQGIAPFNTLTLRSSQFVRTAPSYMTQSMGPQPQPFVPVQRRYADYEQRPTTSKSVLLQNQPTITDRMVIKTPKDEYKDIPKHAFSIKSEHNLRESVKVLRQKD